MHSLKCRLPLHQSSSYFIVALPTGNESLETFPRSKNIARNIKTFSFQAHVETLSEPKMRLQGRKSSMLLANHRHSHRIVLFACDTFDCSAFDGVDLI